MSETEVRHIRGLPGLNHDFIIEFVGHGAGGKQGGHKKQKERAKRSWYVAQKDSSGYPSNYTGTCDWLRLGHPSPRCEFGRMPAIRGACAGSEMPAPCSRQL